jgi:recombination protein RecR
MSESGKKQPGDPLGELVGLLGRLPGIGERTATRLAFHVLGGDATYASALGESLANIHERVVRCERCGNYGAEAVCLICADTRREEGVLCVVARVPDLVAIERSYTYRGRYHVLHGLLAPLDGVGPEDLSLDPLLRRIEAEAIREVIVATPLNVEGEATALYISQVLQEETKAKVSRIASGVPHGGELEFTDQVTLGRALQDRKNM